MHVIWLYTVNCLQICEKISRFSASKAQLTNLTLMKEMKIYWMISWQMYNDIAVNVSFMIMLILINNKKRLLQVAMLIPLIARKKYFKLKT